MDYRGWNIIEKPKDECSKDFHKLSDLINKMNNYKTDKKLLKKNKRFLKRLCNEGTFFHLAFLARSKHEDIAYFIALIADTNDELGLDLDFPACSLTPKPSLELCIYALHTRGFEIELILMIFKELKKVLSRETLERNLNHFQFRKKTFVNWVVDPHFKPSQDKVNYLCDFLELCIDCGYDISHRDDTKNDLYDALNTYKTCDRITELKQYMFVNQFDNFLKLLNGDKEHDKTIIEDVFRSIEHADASYLLDRCIELKLATQDLKKDDIDELVITGVERLLNAGLNPHFINNNYIINFIKSKNGIFNENDVVFISKLLDSSIKYGFDINRHPDIFNTFINGNSNLSTWLMFYKFICSRGYITYPSNFDFNGGFLETVNPLAKELKDLYNFNYNIDYLNKVLWICYRLQLEDNFKDNLVNLDADIVNIFKKGWYKELIDALAKFIFIKIKESVNLNSGKITADEFLGLLFQLIPRESIKEFNGKNDDIKKYLKLVNF